MDEKLHAADSRVGVGRKRGGMPDIKKLRRELDQVWQDIPMPKAQGRIAVHQQSSTSMCINHERLHQLSYKSVVQTNYAYSGARQGIREEAESLIEAYFSEYKNFDRPITDGNRELQVAQFLQVFEPLDEATMGKKSNATPKTCKMANPNYSNRCLIQLDNIFEEAKIEYDQWKLQQNKFQQETWGCQMVGKECKDKIRELTMRLQQQERDVEDCQFQVRELKKNLDALKEKMDGGKTNWSDLAFSIASVLASAISIAVPFFCPSLAPVWLTVIKIACAIAPCLLCKILPTMWNWVEDFLKKLGQKIKSSKS